MPRPHASIPAWGCRGKLRVVYVNADASYREGEAAIAYESAVLGRESRLVRCKSNTEAELRALLFAMEAAEQVRLTHVVFRTDCTSAAHPHLGGNRALLPLRERVLNYVAQHAPDWQLEQVPRESNRLANQLARQTRKSSVEVIGDVRVLANASVACEALARAGIEEAEDTRWRSSEEGDPANVHAAICAALAMLAQERISLQIEAEAEVDGEQRAGGRPVRLVIEVSLDAGLLRLAQTMTRRAPASRRTG